MSKDYPIFSTSLSEAESQSREVPGSSRTGNRAQSPDGDEPGSRNLSHVVPPAGSEDPPQVTFTKIGSQVKSSSQVDRESVAEGKLEQEFDGAAKEPRNPLNATLESESSITQALPDNAPVWKVYLQQAKAHDDEFVKVQNSDLDSILIFAGLFSAILSAFLIEIRKGLQEDLQSTTNDLLRALLTQNATVAAVPVPFQPTLSSIWINALWFLSLTLSLVSALGTILAKGWITQYTAFSTSGVAADDACLHHRRFNGITHWHLKTAVNCLPILIHIAFFFFFAGLVILLGEDISGVQDIVLALVAATILIYIASTLLPLLYPDCPFRTPVSALITRFISFRGIVTRFFPTISQGPSQDTLKANALAWMLLNSTHKTDIWMSIEAIAGLPITAEVQLGLSWGNAAGVLVQVLSEYVEDFRSGDSVSADIRHRVETCLYAILRLVQTGPPGGPTGNALASIVRPGGSLAQWSDLGPGIAEVALCVKARIALLYLDWKDYKDIFDTEVPIMFRAVSQPEIKQMLGEILTIYGSHPSPLLQFLRCSEFDYHMAGMKMLSDDMRSGIKQEHLKLSNSGSIRALIQSLHTDDNQSKIKVLAFLEDCFKNDVWWKVLNNEGIEMILSIGEDSKADGKIRNGEVRNTDRDVTERSRDVVASMVKYESIRMKIIHSDILDTVVKDFINSGPTLDVMLVLSEYEDFRTQIVNTGASVTIANWLKDRDWLNQSVTRDGVSKLLQYDVIREKLFDTNTLATIIASLNKKGNYVQMGALEAISQLAPINGLRAQLINPEVLGTIVTFLNGGDGFMQLTALEAVLNLSQNDEIRTQLLNAGALISVLLCLKESVIVQGFALKILSKLSQYDDIRLQLLTSDFITIIITWLKTKTSLFIVLDILPIILQYNDLRAKLFNSDVLSTVIIYLKENDTTIQQAAFEAITAFSKYSDTRMQIINSDTHMRIITCLRDNEFLAKAALKTVTELSKYDDIRRDITSSDILITLIKGCKDSQSNTTLDAIAQLLGYSDIRAHVIGSGILDTVINWLKAGEWTIQQGALKVILKFSKHDDIRTQITTGFDMPVLVLNWLKDSDSEVQKAALEAVTELSKYMDTREQLLNSDVISVVINYLKDSHSDVRAAALGTMLEIFKHDDIKSQIISSDALVTMINWLKESDSGIKSTILEAVAELSQNAHIDIKLFHLHLIPVLPDILSDPFTHTQVAGASMLSSLGHHEDIRVAAITPACMLPLLGMLSSRDWNKCIAATETLLALGIFDQIG